MTQPPTRPRCKLIPRPEATADVVADHGPDVVAAALAVTDDLALAEVLGRSLGRGTSAAI